MNTLALIALFGSAVLAQIPGLPDCSQSCITDYGGCNQVDVECICRNQPLLEKLSCCVSQQCNEADIQEVISFADSLCGGFGVTTLPTAATCAATGAGSASTASASGTASMTESASMTMTSAPSTESVSSAIESGAASVSSEVSEAISSAASAATGSSEAAAPTNAFQAVLGLGVGAAGLLAAAL